jgi:DNA-binding NtrC family response regulator
MERALIEKTPKRTRGNKSAAARLLQIHRRTIYNRLREYGVDVAAR